MPMDSAAIAAMNGQFQQGYAQQIAYAGMIGMGGRPWGGAPPPQVQGDQYAGMALNRAAAIGAPAMGLGLGLAGLDPMSMAMRGGMAGYAMGGIGGAAMGAVGYGLPAYAAWKGASYAGEQVYAGAQQQQMLNATLRSSFPFQNANGGQGFTGGQMGQIGTMMRGMTHQFGPAGEVVGFEEMTRLAGRMGQMGLSGVTHDVQDFSKKFRNMMDTLKTVAKEMGTSLEAAQEFMGSMRNSGLFQKADQLKFTTGARGIAAAGGLALSEVTGMANIGAQISRSIGGTGKQGVFAGMHTIGTIGTAVQSGILSEEDIYNATGLTGAEGRQALAASQLEHSANFLKSQRGRRFMASMAGKDGTLNMGALNEWMSGGMSAGRTMQRANKNLHGMGRFNFLRNEGRLRGGVLEQLGGLAMPMAYSSWLGERGYDPTNMDDKGMLAFQKYSGLGRDEAEVAIKEVRNLPRLIESRRLGMEDDRLGQERATYQKSMGLEGVKNRVTQLKEKINGTLQEAGQDLFSHLSTWIETRVNRMLDTYSSEVDQSVWNNFRSAQESGNVAGLRRTFMNGSFLSGRGGVSDFGQMSQGSGLADRMYKRPPLSSLLGGSSDMETLANAGWNPGSTRLSDRDMSMWMTHIRGVSSAAGRPNADYGDLGRTLRDDMLKLYSSDEFGKLGGGERMQAFGAFLKQKGASAQWDEMGARDRAGLMAGAELGAGIPASARAAARLAIPSLRSYGLGSVGAYASETERWDAFGSEFIAGAFAHPGTAAAERGLAGAGFVTNGADREGSFTRGLMGGDDIDDGRRYETVTGKPVAVEKSPIAVEAVNARALGAFLDKSGKGLAYDLFSADTSPEKRAEARRRTLGRLAELQKPGGLTRDERAEQYALQGFSAAAEYAEVLETFKNDPTLGQSYLSGQVADIGKRYNMTEEGMKHYLDKGILLGRTKAGEDAKVLLERQASTASKDAESSVRAGVATYDEGGRLTLSGATRKELSKIKGGEEILTGLLDATQLDIDAGGTSRGGDVAMGEQESTMAAERRRAARERMGAMSEADLRKMASAGSLEGTREQQILLGEAGRKQSLNRGLSRGGLFGGVGAVAGLTSDQVARLSKFNLADKDQRAEALNVLAGQMGLDKSDDNLQRLDSALTSLQEGQRVTGSKREGKLSAGANAFADLVNERDNDPAAKERRKDEMMANAEQTNPVVIAITKLSGEITKLVPKKGEVQTVKVSNADEIGKAASGKGKPEDPPKDG